MTTPERESQGTPDTRRHDQTPAAAGESFANALQVVRRLREAGQIAYFAGGCVRDVVMGVTPSDYDVATDAPPAKVRAVFRNTQAVGAAFGVILVRLGGSMIEVATFRSDGKYQDGRHPTEVRFASAREDAQRRDFTINGLFLDPLNDQLLDYVGGRADIESRTLRAIGDPPRRFDEDYLRLLRAVRFAARLDFEIEPKTAAAIADHAGMLRRISPERVGEEVRLMLTPATRVAAWKLLRRFALLPELFRFLPSGTEANTVGRDVIFEQLAPGSPVEFGLALAAATLSYRLSDCSTEADALKLLCDPEAGASTRTLRQSLKLSNDETERLHETLTGLAPLLASEEPTVAAKKRSLSRPTSNSSRLLMTALRATGFFRERIDRLTLDFSQLEATDYAPPPHLTGDDLTAAGLTPGPLFKKLLDQVYDAQLESRVKSKEEALTLAMLSLPDPTG